jgi:hypothetical protein
VLQRSYLNYDLAIEPGPDGGYRARVLDSPAGETRPVRVQMPFSDLELENLLLKVGQPRRRAVRSMDAPEVDAVRTFGARLFEAVFVPELRTALATSVHEAETAGAGLRLRLRLTDCPELADIPWEYLYDGNARRFLALSEWTPVVRYLDLPGRIRPLAVEPPLRVLVMAASPVDFEPLDVEAEWAKVKDALRDVEAAGRVEVDRVPSGRLHDLREQLRGREYHVFHFIGHGRYDPHIGDGVLALEGRDGRAQTISGADLGALLHDHRSLRMALLNSCEGARGGRTDPYSGTAQSLVHQGIPAVVAMQFEITDTSAIVFSHSLYDAVADGFPLDAAVSEARNAVRDQPNPVEWATPVLYLRAHDGRIFDVTGQPGRGVPPTTRRPELPGPAPAPPAQPPPPEGELPPGSPWWRRHARPLAAAVGAALVTTVATVAVSMGGPADDGRGSDAGGASPPSVPDVVRVNFQSADAEVPDGYLRDFGEPYGAKSQGLTYGWVHEGTTVPVDIVSQGRDRDSQDAADQREDTLVHMEAFDTGLGRVVPAAWELAVPDGRYAVSVSVGDQAHNSIHTINVEGKTAISQFRGTPQEDYQQGAVTVDVTDGRLTVDSAGGENTKINYLTVTRL